MSGKISVVIPTHYRNDLLPEAIDSVLQQDYEPVEIIVVDDSGEGHAKPVLKQYPSVTSIIREENGGWQAAYTSGIEASSGDYIQLLDDDDRLLEGKLQKTADVLEANPEVGVAYCGVIRGEDDRCYPKPEVAGDALVPALQFRTFPLWTGSMLIEREVLIECMPFAGMAEGEDLVIELGDTDLKIELAKRTELGYVDECLVYYRRDGNKLWTGLRKFRKIKQNIHHQEELYDQYPEIRRKLLTEWYERQGKNYLRERLWSPRATICFLNSAYHAKEDGMEKLVATAASLLGRPGLNATIRVRNLVASS